jgi:hypothetical protein
MLGDTEAMVVATDEADAARQIPVVYEALSTSSAN